MNTKWELFQKFLITQEEQIQVVDFIINSVIVFVLAWLLELTYRKCGRSLSNRKAFSANFILIGFATMLIISVVKSSLALSLGLVGALSIIRFRAAIKEPEELAYLFLVISFGLGLGANLRLITIVAFAIVMAIIWIRHFISKPDYSNNLYLTINDKDKKLSIGTLENLLKDYSLKFQIKRFDESESGMETTLLLDRIKPSVLENFKNELKKISEHAKISFIDNRVF